MANLPFEDQVSQEVPPVQDPRGLAEWLTRTIININGALRAIIGRVLSFKGVSIIHFEGFSFNDQIPTALDTPMQVSFGAATSVDAPLAIDASGTMTCNLAGSYIFETVVAVGREGVPDYANLVFYGTLNDVEYGPGVAITVDSPGDHFPLTATFRNNLVVGDVRKFYLLRDSSGSDSGGLYTYVPTFAGASDIPSAFLRVTAIGLAE